jgi:hypothetical protein
VAELGKTGPDRGQRDGAHLEEERVGRDGARGGGEADERGAERLQVRDLSGGIEPLEPQLRQAGAGRGERHPQAHPRVPRRQRERLDPLGAALDRDEHGGHLRIPAAALQPKARQMDGQEPPAHHPTPT